MLTFKIEVPFFKANFLVQISAERRAINNKRFCKTMHFVSDKKF